MVVTELISRSIVSNGRRSVGVKGGRTSVTQKLGRHRSADINFQLRVEMVFIGERDNCALFIFHPISLPSEMYLGDQGERF